MADAPKPATPAAPQNLGGTAGFNQSEFEKVLRENLPAAAAAQLIALSKRVK